MIIHLSGYLHQLQLAETFNGLLGFRLNWDLQVFEIEIQLEGVANLLLRNVFEVELEIDANLALINRFWNR